MKIYVIKTADFTAGQIDSINAALPPVRQESAARISLPAKRAESIAAAYLAYFSMTDYAFAGSESNQGIVYPTINILLGNMKAVSDIAERTGWPVGEYGKPFPQGIERNGKTFYVSVSHSGGIVAAAVAEKPIGVDIQQIPAMTREQMLRIASKFHADEQTYLALLPECRLPAEFCRLWACKESVMKLCGKGLCQSMSFRIDDGSCILDGNPVRLTGYPLEKGYLAAAEYKK